ncbi:Yip1 family protein [Phosphitispora fastidiosa]|uniref:Yip1 family protein n=1 Tax=Phosphitispora fastidiosa TaxID=2837202 RepID=UPI001E47C51C|nr:Yip1 family protein [Phosphitispora fastidiosa]MBU7007337.1 hypothetical protein [Phosphitispora fastidiosa]
MNDTNDMNDMNDMSDMSDLPLDDSKDRLGFVELIYGVLFSPTATFAKVSRENHLFNGFVIFLTITLVSSVVNYLGARNFSDLPPELAGAFTEAGPYMGILAVVFAFIGWFVQAGILQVFAELLGGEGRALQVLTVLALAGIPKAFAIPFQVLGLFISGSMVSTFLSVAVSLLVITWFLVLMVIGLREVQGFSTGRAAAVFVLPLAALGLAFLIIVLSLAGFFIPLINSL